MSLEHSPVRSYADGVSDPSFTIGGFCQAEHISRSMLYKAWKEGWGPAYYWNGNTRRITSEARKAWHKQREAAAAEAEPAATKT
jgi:hypothetical protein